MDILSRPAEEFENDAGIESAWVMKAVKHMEIHFNILCSVDPRHLRLSKFDDEIYKEFRSEFPDLCISKVDVEELKSPAGKEKWREFCNRFDQVPDFNFGTLLRINSDGDYNDENTVFVPRIQFYAFEIARNREGFNDSIRHSFKPENKKESDERTDLASYITAIKETVQLRYHTKCSVKKENGSTKKGDLSLFIQNNFQLFQAETVKQICSYGVAWRVKACSLLPDSSRLLVTLDRNTLFRCVLPSFCQEVNAGESPLKCALVLVTDNDNLEDLESLRTSYLCDMLTKVLLFNRYCVHVNRGSKNESGAVYQIPPFHKCVSEGPTDLSARESCMKELSTSCKNQNGKTFLAVEEVAKLLPSVVSNVPVQQEDILISSEGKFSPAFEMAVWYDHIMKNHFSMEHKPSVAYHIASQRKIHHCHRSILLWEALSKTKIKHICIAHNIVNVPQNVTPSSTDIYRYKLKSVEDAMAHKYGNGILGDGTWKPRMETLAESCLRTEVLSVSAASPVWIREDPKLGCFIQYNCARISHIIKQHEGFSEKISCPESPDYGLLTKDEEWQLFWNYIVTFLQSVESLTDTEHGSFQFHKICNMVHCLSRDFSQYYGKVKILTSVRQLEPTMHSRVSLLRALLCVFERSLDLMGLPCLREM